MMMMMMKLCVLAIFLAVQQASGSSSLCAVNSLIEEGHKYHADGTCGELSAYNAFKDNMGRYARYNAYRNSGSYASVPNQRTVVCPGDQAEVSLQDPSYTVGMDTVWFVQNTAKEPVVVAFVTEEGVEVSAKNTAISPPQDDPEAILQPNMWMPIYTFEGHVFHVRTLTQDGSRGDLLLQHRVGLIPVGQHLASQLSCSRADPMRLDENGQLDEAYAREEPAVLRPCNTLDVGFRNMAGCPMDVYYIVAPEQQGLLKPNDPRRKDEFSACTEIFRFHLGVEQTGLEDFMWTWESATKFEGTFVGHSFAFRLSTDPSVLVDRVTLQPTLVPVCPNRGKKAITSGGYKSAVPTGVANPNGPSSESTSSSATTTVAASTRDAAQQRRRRRCRQRKLDVRIHGSYALGGDHHTGAVNQTMLPPISMTSNSTTATTTTTTMASAYMARVKEVPVQAVPGGGTYAF